MQVLNLYSYLKVVVNKLKDVLLYDVFILVFLVEDTGLEPATS